LTAWWSELRCRRLFGDIVRPDAYGRWREDGHQIEFFLEFDFGTEALGTLASKLHSYEKLATATGITTPVLVWLPTHRRETAARRALAETQSQLDRPALVPLATSAADVAGVAGENNPAVARWLPIGGSSARRPGRLRLAELAQHWPHLDTSGPAPAAPAAQGQPKAAELMAPTPLPPHPQPTRFERR
jgi:hypothetical protein